MPRLLSLKQCLSTGYAHIESANFWAALGDRAEEQAALIMARDCFRQPKALQMAGREKAEPLLKQVDARLRKMRHKRVD